MPEQSEGDKWMRGVAWPTLSSYAKGAAGMPWREKGLIKDKRAMPFIQAFKVRAFGHV